MFLVCGDQMVEQYSRFDLTRDLYVLSMIILCLEISSQKS